MFPVSGSLPRKHVQNVKTTENFIFCLNRSTLQTRNERSNSNKVNIFVIKSATLNKLKSKKGKNIEID
jgi:hypothetical protein